MLNDMNNKNLNLVSSNGSQKNSKMEKSYEKQASQCSQNNSFKSPQLLKENADPLKMNDYN